MMLCSLVGNTSVFEEHWPLLSVEVNLGHPEDRGVMFLRSGYWTDDVIARKTLAPLYAFT
jgi:hypothetical protein